MYNPAKCRALCVIFKNKCFKGTSLLGFESRITFRVLGTGEKYTIRSKKKKEKKNIKKEEEEQLKVALL